MEMIKKRMTGILTMLLVSAVVIGFTPQIALPVYADDPIPEPDETYTADDGWEGTLVIDENKTVKFSGVIHNNSEQNGGSAIKICNGATVSLVFEGDNVLSGYTSGNPDSGSAGIEVESGSTVNIYGLEGSTLHVTGGKYGAGIGGIGYGSVSETNPLVGNINIYSGTIIAIGGERGAGIGSGYHSSAGIINILGGDITALGTASGAGIGSGYATSGGAPIAAKVGYYNGGEITISGGTIRAASWHINFDNFDQYDPETMRGEGNVNTFAAGIGGGYGASSGNIIIEGNADVTALGSCGGAGIGNGRGTDKVANYKTDEAFCNIKICGNAKVVAMATGDHRNGRSGGAGIGLGEHWEMENTPLGTVSIEDNANVYAYSEIGANGIGAANIVNKYNGDTPPGAAHLASLSIDDGCTVIGICGHMNPAREGIDEYFNVNNVAALSFTDEFLNNAQVGDEGPFFKEDMFPVKIDVMDAVTQDVLASFPLTDPEWTRVGIHLPNMSPEEAYYKISDHMAENGIGVLLARSEEDNGFRFGADWIDVTDLIYEKYSIIYHLNDGKNASGNPSDFAVYGPAVNLLDPSRSGYSFSGWFDNEELSGNKVTSIPAGSVGDRELWAKWQKKAEPAPAAKISGTLLAKMTAKGKTGLVLSWNEIKGAEGYDIFFSICGKEAPKKVKTIKGNMTFKWTKSGLKKRMAYKAVVKAYVMKNGKKTYVKTSPMVHAYTSGSTKNYTNSKSVTVKKASVSLTAGKTYKIKASVTKLKKGKKLMPSSHAAKLRYVSSNNKIATVSKSGKITAKAKGTCKVYVIAINGARKAVTITVK